MENKVTVERIERKIKHVSYQVVPGTTTTICNIVLQNDFTVIGTSACVDPSSFNKKMGEQIAYEDAFNKIWPLEGYLLKEELYQDTINKLTGEVKNGNE